MISFEIIPAALPFLVGFVVILLVFLVASLIISEIKSWKTEKEEDVYIVTFTGKVKESKRYKSSLEKIKEMAIEDLEKGKADLSDDGVDYKYYFLVTGDSLDTYNVETVVIKKEDGEIFERVFSPVELYELKRKSYNELYSEIISDYSSLVNWLKEYTL